MVHKDKKYYYIHKETKKIIHPFLIKVAYFTFEKESFV